MTVPPLLPALGYPWAPPATSGLLTRDRYWPVNGTPHIIEQVEADTIRHGGVPFTDRTLAVAVGSNASPHVLARKLWDVLDAGVPFASGTVVGIAVGHLATVATRGFIPAAPYPAPGARTRLWGSWLTDEQLAALDATEPNYRRVRITQDDYHFTFDDGTVPDSYDVYESLVPLLSDGTNPLGLRTQRELFDELGGPFANADPDQLGVSAASDWMYQHRAHQPVRLLHPVRLHSPAVQTSLA